MVLLGARWKLEPEKEVEVQLLTRPVSKARTTDHTLALRGTIQQIRLIIH